MTDEELIKQLREVTGSKLFFTNTPNHLRLTAADRIEQLQDKLTKAVNALREIKSVECTHCTDLFNELADAVLDGTEGET
jgi:hypothetical protein